MAASTARDVLLRAFRRIGIVAEGEPMNADQISDGLRILNDMMHGFNSRGIQYAHVDLAETDRVNVPDEQVNNVVLLMAYELAGEYGKTLGPALEARILDATQGLQAHYYVVRPAVGDIGLRNRTAWRGSDIEVA